MRPAERIDVASHSCICGEESAASSGIARTPVSAGRWELVSSRTTSAGRSRAREHQALTALWHTDQMPDYKALAEACLDGRTALWPAATRRRLESLRVLIRREGATSAGP